MVTAIFIYYVFSLLFMVGVNVRDKDFKFWMFIYLLFFSWMIFPTFWGDYFTTKRKYYEDYQRVEK